MVEDILMVRKEKGHPISKMYFHVEHAVRLVNEGRLHEAGFAGYSEDDMLSSLMRLAARGTLCGKRHRRFCGCRMRKLQGGLDVDISHGNHSSLS